MRRLSTRSRGDTLFLGWETPRSWSIGRCNTTPRLCCEICCDSLFLFPPLCCGQWGRGLSRGLALAAASGPSVAGLEAAPGTALRGCSGNAAGRPPPPPLHPCLRELGVSLSGSVGRFLSSWQSVCDGSFCSTWQGRVGRVESGNDLFLFSANHKHPIFSLGIQGSLIAWKYLLSTLYVL